MPIGILAAVGFIVFLKEGVARRSLPIDIAGAALFTVAVASLMVALTEYGTSDMTGTMLGLALFVVSGLLFIRQERRAQDPMVTLDLWGQRPIAAANGVSLLAGMAVIGLTTFLPVYVQGVLQQSPLVAGFALTMMVMGWPVGATVSARVLGRFGLRQVLICGAALLPVGALFFLSLHPTSSPIVAGLGSLVMGFGMGLLSTACLVLVQDIVEWAQRGSATASNIFSRNLGSTLGATVFGAVLNYGLAHSKTGAIAADRSVRVRRDRGRDPAGAAGLPAPDVLGGVRRLRPGGPAGLGGPARRAGQGQRGRGGVDQVSCNNVALSKIIWSALLSGMTGC